MLKLTDKLEEIRILLENEIQNAERIALQSLFGAYMRRIFNEGKATDETQIGEYSKKPMLTGSKNFRTAGSAKSFFSKKNEWLTVKTTKGKQALAIVPGGYSEFRTLNGLQNQYVDLEFRGDLFRSIIVAEFNGHIVLGFNNSKEAIISRELEIKYKKAIFEPSTSEIQLAKEMYDDYLKEKLQELFDKW